MPISCLFCSCRDCKVRHTCRCGCATSTIASNQVLHLLSIILICKCNSYVPRCRIRLEGDAAILSISDFYSCYRIHHSPLTAFRSPWASPSPRFLNPNFESTFNLLQERFKRRPLWQDGVKLSQIERCVPVAVSSWCMCDARAADWYEWRTIQ